MDETTLRAYADHAAEISQRHLAAASGIARHFALAFPDRGARILDVGAGSGRDLALLVSEGYAAYGVEPVAAMRAEAVRHHPRLEGLIFEGALPGALPPLSRFGTAESPSACFDGLVCSAVLQHLPRAELFDAVFSLRRLLRPGGRALVSIPACRDDLGPDGRDPLGRHFNGVQPGELELLFERVGFRTLSRAEDADGLGRRGTRWAVLLFELAHAGESLRPLDRIEAVLRRDRKTTTYKFALLRALTDLAARQPRRVRWRADGRVEVPLAAVSELWVEYYWPLFASRTFLPQKGGDAGRHRLGFARELEDLARRFERSGGLAGFLSSQRAGELDGVASRRHRVLLRKLGEAVRKGPVHHAGRSTHEALFDFDAETRSILVDEALWREIALMSHWLRDSLCLRWAEQSAAFAGGGEAQDVFACSIRLLIEPPGPERDTGRARDVYARLASRRCVWTGCALPREFEIDHVIPFALWQNNDLWNLLPASPKANREKSDRLPERSLLRGRRGLVLEAWQHLREAMPVRFDSDLSRLTGHEGPDLEDGFDALCEAVEVTALQRGCERWAPR